VSIQVTNFLLAIGVVIQLGLSVEYCIGRLVQLSEKMLIYIIIYRIIPFGCP